MMLVELLREVRARHGSDLHLTTGAPPVARVDGTLTRLAGADLTADDTERLAFSVVPDVQRRRFEQAFDIDFSCDVPGAGRVRCNLFRQRGAVAAVYRLIPERIGSFDELGLPPVLATFVEKPRGLVLVTGATGSGKSTTLAALVDRINDTRSGHILTVEDPIEFLHPHRSCIVNQREIPQDACGFAAALRAALREDPDVVLIGEMRDIETMESALRIAETGHLTFATLHTNSAAQTVHRIVSAFPAHQQSQVRTQLALGIEGVVCQALLPRIGGGRVAAFEVMIPTPAIRNLIREDKTHQIDSMMQASGHVGMQTLNRSVAMLYHKKAITYDSALSASSNPEELQAMIRRGGSLAGSGGPRRIAPPVD
jgi:twitching motility protein PilT